MKRFFILLMAVLAIASCGKDNPEEKEEKTEKTEETSTPYMYVNYFGRSCMGLYYLWTKEISEDLSGWKSEDEPISKVEKIRYKQDGKDFDRWTMMTDDLATFENSVAGVSKTYGYDMQLFYGDAEGSYVVAVVTFVYKDSPAEKAGLKRGDTILTVNGKRMTKTTYVKVVNNELLNSESVSLTLSDGKACEMTAVDMYEDPVVTYKVLDVAGKKVAYLFYSSFTLRSCDRLIEACKHFKAEGAEELILDLRYNGGGYVFAQQVLASMLAPEANVRAGDVLETTVYNEALAREVGDGATKLSFTHSITVEGEELTYNTEDANIGLKKIYAILDKGSASASESLLTVLMPYMPITIVGQQSHGKFCTGIIYGAEDWFDDYKKAMAASTYTKGKKAVKNWGLYVMIGRFADRFGNTPCMPDGFTPDVLVKDNPNDGHQLGDPEETMLARVLSLISGTESSGSGAAARQKRPSLEKVDYMIEKPNFGMHILTKDEFNQALPHSFFEVPSVQE